ncbi:unnamed protein product [Diamesa serratosioi]
MKIKMKITLLLIFMITQSYGSVFDLQNPFYENDLWLQKIPEQMELLINERNQVDNATVISVYYYGFDKQNDDYITETMKVLHEKNGFKNSFIVADSMYRRVINKYSSADSMMILFVDISILHSLEAFVEELIVPIQWKSHVFILIVPLQPISPRSIINFNITNGFNTGFLILNNETYNAEYYDYNKFAQHKMVNRTGRYEGIFQSKNNNWMGKSIRVSALHDPPTTIVENGKLKGFDGYYLDLICQQLNATYDIVEGNFHPTVICSNSLSFDLADLCMNTDSYVKRHLRHNEIINLAMYDDVSVLVPANTVINVSTYFRPFDDVTWKVLIANIFMSVVVWKILFYIYYRIRKEKNITDVTFNIVELTVTASVAKEPQNKMEAIFISFLGVFNFIILVAYSSVLISSLLDPKFVNIDTIDDLRASNLTFVADFNILTTIYEPMHHLNLTAPLLMKEDKHFTGEITNDYAFVLTKNRAYHYLNSHKHIFYDKIKLHEMKEHFYSVERSIKVHSKLKLGDIIAMLSLRIREAGLNDYWKGINELTMNRLTKKNINDKLAVTHYVGMDELHFMFWFLMIGWLCALTIFLLESSLYFIKKKLQMILLKMIVQQWIVNGRQ